MKRKAEDLVESNSSRKRATQDVRYQFNSKLFDRFDEYQSQYAKSEP
jgi:hypothetical protein